MYASKKQRMISDTADENQLVCDTDTGLVAPNSFESTTVHHNVGKLPLRQCHIPVIPASSIVTVMCHLRGVKAVK